jgi:hypothetical protein
MVGIHSGYHLSRKKEIRIQPVGKSRKAFEACIKHVMRVCTIEDGAGSLGTKAIIFHKTSGFVSWHNWSTQTSFGEAHTSRGHRGS